MRGFNWRVWCLVVTLGLIQVSTLAHAVDHQLDGKLESSCLSCANLSFATLESGNGIAFNDHAVTGPASSLPVNIKPVQPPLTAQPRAPPHSH